MNIQDWKGDWALVTGASSGIGKAFAEHLAAEGLNIVLVARRRERLEALARDIEHSHPVRAHVAALDLTAPGAPEELRAALVATGIRVRLLVNNAGFGRWGRFEETAPETYDRMIRLNTFVLPATCSAFMADLVSFPSSAVINVSSAAALQPVPYMAVYAATKAFVQSFSLALFEEWREKGVCVQTLVPGPTRTEFDEVAGAYATRLGERRESAEAVVRASLLGLRRDVPLVAAARGTLRQRLLAAVIPSRVFLREAGKLFRPPPERG